MDASLGVLDRPTLIRRFETFFKEYNGGFYKDMLEDKVQDLKGLIHDDSMSGVGRPSCVRVPVLLADVVMFGVDLGTGLVHQPIDYISAMQSALEQIAAREFPVYAEEMKENGIPILVGLEGSMGDSRLTPRTLTAKYVGKLVTVEGMLTRISPRLVSPVDADDRLQKENQFNQSNEQNSKPAKPQKNIDDILFYDTTKAILQERPEAAPRGQMPRSVPIMLTHDLVGKVRPGDPLLITGVYHAFPNTFLHAYSVQEYKPDQGPMTYDISTVKTIRELATDPNLFTKFAESIAPNVIIPVEIKMGLLLQLLGGCQKMLDGGGQIRGDMHCLLVGDPSTAKSQLLRAIMRISPHGVSTSGRGSSAAGLTAAVTTEKVTGERRLEAGAVVLADKGVLAVDEFDKMIDRDRVALHEAMEQQTVTIAKAGLHATLNARCSILAAANPVYGTYRRDLTVYENLNLPDSLLSRFDFLFIMLDIPDRVKDALLAKHVLNLHRLIPAPPALDNEFIRKYIHYAKERSFPKLTREAADLISTEYMNLRMDIRPKTLPVTPRMCETLIRASMAHAKLYLKQQVTVEDCLAVFPIVRYSLFNCRDDKNVTKAADVMNLEVAINENKVQGGNIAGAEQPHREMSKEEKDWAHEVALLTSETETQLRYIKFVLSIIFPKYNHAVTHKQLLDAMNEKIKEYSFKTNGDNVPLISEDTMRKLVETLAKEDKIFVHDDIIYS